jgi:hypothetical protein
MRVARSAYWHAGARPPVDINKISVRSIALSEYLPSKSGTLELVVGHIDDVPDDLVPRIGFTADDGARKHTHLRIQLLFQDTTHNLKNGRKHV